MTEFSHETIERLIQQELQGGEEAGQELYRHLGSGIVSPEEFSARLRGAKGYGLWWGAESSWGLKETKVEEVRRLTDGRFEVLAACTLEYMSGHILAGTDRRPPEGRALVRLRVKEDLTVEEFHFQWR